MLLDRSRDRVLTTTEAKQLLAEDTENDDIQVKTLMKRWNSLLSASQWVSDTLIPDHLIRAKAWKDGSLYRLKPAHSGSLRISCKTFQLICWLAKKPYKSALEGLSMFDIEELVRKIEANRPIKVLLDEGFTLSLIVHKVDVNF